MDSSYILSSMTKEILYSGCSHLATLMTKCVKQEIIVLIEKEIKRIPVDADKGIVCISAYHVLSNTSALRLAEIARSLCAKDKLPDGQRAVGAEHRHASVFPID